MGNTKKPKTRSWTDSRKCLHCRESFTPRRPQDWDSDFCCAQHRNMFYKHGNVRFEKLSHSLEGIVDSRLESALKPLMDRIEKLERREKKSVDLRNLEVVT